MASPHEMDSHFVMSLQGWTYPISRHELYAAATFARVVAVTRGKGEPDLELEFPWDGTQAPDVTPEERQALTEQLRARSAFGQKRMEALNG